MADKKKKIVPKGSQKPNYQVWIIVTLLIVVFIVTIFNKSSSTKPITPHQFEEMMLSNDIEKVVLIRNHRYVEITLKPEALQNARYRTELENNSPFGISNGLSSMPAASASRRPAGSTRSSGCARPSRTTTSSTSARSKIANSTRSAPIPRPARSSTRWKNPEASMNSGTWSAPPCSRC